MFTEKLIYLYMLICISMILFNIIYMWIEKIKDKAMSIKTDLLEKEIKIQLLNLMHSFPIEEKHKRFLTKKLLKTENLIIFEKVIEKLYDEDKETCLKYLYDLYPIAYMLIVEYQNKDTMQASFLLHILWKYQIKFKYDKFYNVVLNYIVKDNLYCRENALKVIYASGNSEYVLKALLKLDKMSIFHHSKLISEGLLSFQGDKKQLANDFFVRFELFSDEMKVSVLNYFRLANIRSDEYFMYILIDDVLDDEVKFSAIRYFGKFYCETAYPYLLKYAKGNANERWQYSAIASAALSIYPSDMTFIVLKKNLSSSNWNIRVNAAKSLDKMGFTADEILSMIDEQDYYAREIMVYQQEQKKMRGVFSYE